MSHRAGQEPVKGREPLLPLRRNRGFRLLWIGQLLSNTGTDAAVIAYPLLILALTHSPATAGIVGTARLVVQIVLGLPGGVLTDRFDRRLTMIACDSVRAAVLAVLAALVVLDVASWPVVLAVAVIDGAMNVLFNPAAMAALPAIVADEQLERAWAGTEARTYAANLAGPALGGFLFGLASAVPFASDAASYLVSAATVSRIHGKFSPERSTGRKAMTHEAIEALHLMWHNSLLRAAMIQAPLVSFAFAGVVFTITVALRQHGTAPGIVGLAQAGIAGGGLIGAIVAPKLQERLPLWRLAIMLTVSATVLFGVAAVLLPSPLAAVPVGTTFVLAPAANAALIAAMLRAAPENMRGRVNSAGIATATGLAALAPLVSGLLIEHVSSQWAMVAFAAAVGVSAIMCAALPGLRNAEGSEESNAVS